MKQFAAWYVVFVFDVWAGIAALAVGAWKAGIYLVLVGAAGLLATDTLRTYWSLWCAVRD